jgi:glycosyltransferase involved in cell wall biosynthesis
MAKVNSAYRAIGHRPRQTALLKDIGANLLFCPFTAPLFFDPTVPVVSVVVDLQHLYYPQFFGPDDRYQRDAHFRTACRFASKLVCISDYVRNTVLEKSGLNADHVVAIHIRLSQRLAGSSPEKQAQIIGQFGLSGVRFLLYPANFWPHKNHRMLLTAFGMYRNRHPRSDLKLVCTGTPGANMDTLRDAATRAGLDGWVLFPGFLPDEEFAALLESSLALIFPSLYEGFGMPVLEAMALGKPVLCSNVTSLPEIAGDAAILFDPRKPADITHAIERLEDDPALAADLSGRGKQRAAAFGDPAEMAAQYLRVFSEVIGSQSSFADGIHGVYLDGWTNERVVVTYRASDEPRHLEVTFTVPAWLPCERVTAKASHNGNESPEPYVMPRGETTTLRVALPRTSGHLELTIDPVFQPRALRLNDDERTLGCLCQGCRLVSPGGVIDLLATNAG